jgi:hypothetical protein
MRPARLADTGAPAFGKRVLALADALPAFGRERADRGRAARGVFAEIAFVETLLAIEQE